MIELLILVIGLPLIAWILMHMIRFSLKIIERLEKRDS